MKKRMHFLALLLALTVFAGLCTGCGGSQAEDPAVEAENVAPAAAEAQSVAEAEPPAMPATDVPSPSGEPSIEGSGEPAEAPAEFVALDPSGYDRDWAGYQAYLTTACDVETAFPDDVMRQQVKDQIAAASEADYDANEFPYQMLIGMQIAVSYDEFLVA
jgi:hypothetical protein